jgi:hypothetical protein
MPAGQALKAKDEDSCFSEHSLSGCLGRAGRSGSAVFCLKGCPPANLAAFIP